MTGDAFPETEHRCAQAGIDDRRVKPFVSAQQAEMLRQHLNAFRTTIPLDDADRKAQAIGDEATAAVP